MLYYTLMLVYIFLHASIILHFAAEILQYFMILSCKTNAIIAYGSARIVSFSDTMSPLSLGQTSGH
jgi:hypothetical protein